LEFEQENFPIFIDRRKELNWLDQHIFNREYRHTPIVISGLAGIGKTTLVRHWFDRSRSSSEPIWVSLYKGGVNEKIEEIVLQLRLQSEKFGSSKNEPRGVFVVVDDADLVSQRELESIVDRIYNYKIVTQLLIISRKKFELRRAQQLIVEPLSIIASSALIHNLGKLGLSEDQVQKVISLADGNPLVLKTLDQVLTGKNTDQILSGNDKPIYELPSSIILPEKEIISIVQPIIVTAGENLIHSLKQQPGDLRKLSPREFELLLADLLKDSGWDVEVTKQTRDGGSDILAYMNTSVGRFLCLVEAKHYREDRKVGVDLVRALYGTLWHKQASSAMLVTSSSFTKDAKEFQKQHEYQLSLRDYVDVVNWIIKFGDKMK
jgi:HJR/Mrr/RecB family endonuclease/GTPase SAR1 family protein